MHHALRIPEITRYILLCAVEGHADDNLALDVWARRLLTSAALSCTTLSQVALDLLWAYVGSEARLLRLLASDAPSIDIMLSPREYVHLKRGPQSLDLRKRHVPLKELRRRVSH
jgi:hypothetical protein